MDANGNAVAAWVANNFVKASSHPVNGTWTSEVIVSATGASSPCLVLDPNGNATLIWIGDGVIYASTKTLNGNWSTAVSLSNSGTAFPTLGVDSAGNVVAAWVRNGKIECSTKLLGTNWQKNVTINSTGAATPSVSIGGSGNMTRAVLVWQGASGSDNVIFTSTKLLSGNWTNQAVLSNTAHNAASPKVAVDSNANATAVWYEYDVTGVSYTNVTVNSSDRSSLTGEWSCSHILSAPGIRSPSSLSAKIAYDSFGNAIALWNTSFDDETFNIETAVKPVNGQWSAPVNVVSSNLFAFNGALSVSKFGETLALYMYYNGSDLLIQSVESNINGYLNNVWSVPITISLGSGNAYPKVAATVTRNKIYAVAVWEKFGGRYDSIVAVTGSKNLLQPPSALSVTQNTNNFGVFTEYSNTLSWCASSDPNVVGYLIFRNGLFLEQVEADVLHYIDNNRTFNGSVKYCVAAIDAEQTQSNAVSVSFP